MRAFVSATVHGYEDTLRDPARSLAELLAANPGLGRAFTAASLAAYLPLFTDSGRVPFGTVRRRASLNCPAWMVRSGLIGAADLAGALWQRRASTARRLTSRRCRPVRPATAATKRYDGFSRN